jgi:hypothetical protein
MIRRPIAQRDLNQTRTQVLKTKKSLNDDPSLRGYFGAVAGGKIL